jgi:hypothetical protein
MKLFIQEQYVKSRQILVEVPGEGLGILITQDKLRKMLAEGQIDPRVVTHNLMKVVHEH